MPTFATPEPISVTLQLLSAEIRVRASDRDDTVVVLNPSDPSSSEDVEAADRTRVDYSDGRLEIAAPRTWRRFSPFRSGGAIDIDIDLPAGSDLRGEASIAHVQADGRLGACHITTSAGDFSLDRTDEVTLATSGRVSLRRAGGPAEISAAGAVDIGELAGTAAIKNLNGATRLGLVAGDLKCRAANGDIVIATSLGGVEATTSNGDVQVDEVVRGTVSLETGNGRIEIGIRPGTAARLDVSSRFGRVRNLLDAADGPDPSDEVAAVRARTSHGDVVIRRPERSKA
jgi:DUF4097 and DUF4098 domain-containing protein YvlB